MASFTVKILPNGSLINPAATSCHCSFVPDYLLEDIIESDQVSEHARGCARLSLNLNREIRRQRLDRCQRQTNRGGFQTIPRYMLQDVLDSEHSTDDDKQRAQKTLDHQVSTKAKAGIAADAAIPAVKRIIYDAKGTSTLPGTEVRSEGEAVTQDTSASNVYTFFGDTHRMYAEVLHRNSIDDHGLTLEGTIHYDDEQPPPGYNNAFWNGERMVFGDGDNVMFASFTAAVDVIAHELTHGVTENTANLPYWSQSGALNESLSDVFGSITKQYKLNQSSDQADWLIGEGIFAADFQGRALRDMANPGTAYNDPRLRRKDQQVAHMSKYADLPLTENGDNGGVHINSGIPNRAFYLVAKALGGNSWDVAGKVWYKTLLDPRLKSYAVSPANWTKCFAYFAALTMDAAKTYGSTTVSAIKKAWDDVGVVPAKLSGGATGAAADGGEDVPATPTTQPGASGAAARGSAGLGSLPPSIAS